MNEPIVCERVLCAEGLHKSYFRGTQVPVLGGLDLSVNRGEIVSIVGASGSGKSTLLHLLGALDAPDAGAIYWKGERIDGRSAAFRDRFRNRTVGFIFQFYHLLPELSALENVMLPALIRLKALQFFRNRAQVRQRAAELLEQVGLGHRLEHRPIELSGGEVQRAAIARALLHQPELLLADEPTGNLDADTGESIMQLLFAMSRRQSLTVVIVTHDRELASRADRILRLTHGRLEPASQPSKATSLGCRADAAARVGAA